MRRHLARIALALGVATAIAATVVVYRSAGGAAGHTGPARLARTLSVGREDWLAPLAFSPDGRMLATAGAQTVYLVNRATGRADSAWTTPKSAGLTSLAFSPDGSTVAFGVDGIRDSGYLLNVRAKTMQAIPPAPNRDILENIVFSPDGTTLAAASNDTGVIYLFGTAGLRISGTVRAPASWLGGAPIAFSPDGTTLAAGDGWPARGRHRGQIALWDAAGRKLRTTIKLRTTAHHHGRHRHGGAGVSALAFSPDGATLAAGAGRHIYLWDMATGRWTGKLTVARRSIIGDVAFSPDGRMLAAIIIGGHGAYLWSVGTGRLAAAMPDPGGTEVNSIAYSPDGKTVAVGDYNGHIFLWDVSRAGQAPGAS